MAFTVTSIREATLDDCRRLCELCAELGYPCDVQQARSRLESILRFEGNALLLAEHVPSTAVPVDESLQYGTAVGFVHVSIRPLLMTDRVAEICGLVVDSAARGQGYGKALMHAAEQWAAQRDCIEVALRSNIIREEAHQFYRSLGYETYKTSLAFRKWL